MVLKCAQKTNKSIRLVLKFQLKIAWHNHIPSNQWLLFIFGGRFYLLSKVFLKKLHTYSCAENLDFKHAETCNVVYAGMDRYISLSTVVLSI